MEKVLSVFSMCEAVAELAEDDNDRFKICGCLHSFVACFFFQVFDFFAVLLAFVAYYIFLNLVGDGWPPAITIPFSALVISICSFPSGPYGLFMQRPSALIIYLVRVVAILLYSISWSAYTFSKDDSIRGHIFGGVWAASSILYLWGVFVTLKAVIYTTTHYRGYDDVDPALRKHFDEEFKQKMIEIKQRELDEKKKKKGGSVRETDSSAVDVGTSATQKTTVRSLDPRRKKKKL